MIVPEKEGIEVKHVSQNWNFYTYPGISGGDPRRALRELPFADVSPHVWRHPPSDADIITGYSLTWCVREGDRRQTSWKEPCSWCAPSEKKRAATYRRRRHPRNANLIPIFVIIKIDEIN